MMGVDLRRELTTVGEVDCIAKVAPSRYHVCVSTSNDFNQ